MIFFLSSALSRHKADETLWFTSRSRWVIKALAQSVAVYPFKQSNMTWWFFFLSNKNEKCFLEVKNVTLKRKDKIAEFPDAITTRGTKHLKELVAAKNKGFKSCILYLIQREDCEFFKIAKDIDEEYKIAFNNAVKKGIKILCYNCSLNDEEIKLKNEIKYEQ